METNSSRIKDAEYEDESPKRQKGAFTLSLRVDNSGFSMELAHIQIFLDAPSHRYLEGLSARRSVRRSVRNAYFSNTRKRVFSTFETVRD